MLAFAMKTARLIPLALLLVSGRSLAEVPMPPVPDDLLRDLDTDRPDKTNSPHTVDVGHFQIETGLVAFTRNTDFGVRTETWTWVDTDFRIGLIDWAELQLEIPFYQSSRDTDRASHETPQ
jgi:hypothetical protein